MEEYGRRAQGRARLMLKRRGESQKNGSIQKFFEFKNPFHKGKLLRLPFEDFAFMHVGVHSAQTGKAILPLKVDFASFYRSSHQQKL
jgi:hypothetical protein